MRTYSQLHAINSIQLYIRVPIIFGLNDMT